MKHEWLNLPHKEWCFFYELTTRQLGFNPEQYAKFFELLGNQTGIENQGVIFERIGRECTTLRVISTTFREEI